MIGLLLTAAVIFPQSGDDQLRVETPSSSSAAVRLEDVEVVGRPLDSMISDFVREVAAPNNGRGLARWRDPVCVGVANLQREPAQYIVDRVSEIADDLGLKAGKPGCTANALVVATSDGAATANAMVEESPRTFRIGGSGMDRGRESLRRFRASDRPVRWWNVSMPVDSDTGMRAVRIPGDCSGSCIKGFEMAPVVPVFAASRLNSQIVDDIFRTIVIIDVDQVANVTIQQLADYVAMVTFAQIDPDSDTSAYASILNIFTQPADAESLTDWDKAYLAGLYAAERGHVSTRVARSEIVDAIRREHVLLKNEEEK